LVPAPGDWGAGPSQGLKGTCDIATFLDSGDLHLASRVPAKSGSGGGAFLEREAGDFTNAMDARCGGLEVLTGLALIVAPSLLGRLLFGSNLNAAGEATSPGS
jgi:hypothetical protein